MPGGGSGGAIVVERVADRAFVVRSSDAPSEAVGLAVALPPEPSRTTVVVDASATGALRALDDRLLDQFRRRLPAEPGSDLRLVAARAGRPDLSGAPPLAARLADRLGMGVVAPDGELIALRGGELFSAGPGAGWLGFRGVHPEWAGPRYPAPPWQAALPREVRSAQPRAFARLRGRRPDRVTVTAIPAGLWVRGAGAPPLRLIDLGYGVPVEPARPVVLVGAPRERTPEVAELAAFYLSLAPAVRENAVLVPYGPVPEACAALAQSLADRLNMLVRAYHALPHYAADGTRRFAVFGPTGALEHLTTAPENVYVPAGVTRPRGPAAHGRRRGRAAVHEDAAELDDIDLGDPVVFEIPAEAVTTGHGLTATRPPHAHGPTTTPSSDAFGSAAMPSSDAYGSAAASSPGAYGLAAPPTDVHGFTASSREAYGSSASSAPDVRGPAAAVAVDAQGYLRPADCRSIATSPDSRPGPSAPFTAEPATGPDDSAPLEGWDRAPGNAPVPPADADGPDHRLERLSAAGSSPARTASQTTASTVLPQTRDVPRASRPAAVFDPADEPHAEPPMPVPEEPEHALLAGRDGLSGASSGSSRGEPGAVRGGPEAPVPPALVPEEPGEVHSARQDGLFGALSGSDWREPESVVDGPEAPVPPTPLRQEEPERGWLARRDESLRVLPRSDQVESESAVGGPEVPPAGEMALVGEPGLGGDLTERAPARDQAPRSPLSLRQEESERGWSAWRDESLRESSRLDQPEPAAGGPAAAVPSASLRQEPEPVRSPRRHDPLRTPPGLPPAPPGSLPAQPGSLSGQPGPAWAEPGPVAAPDDSAARSAVLNSAMVPGILAPAAPDDATSASPAPSPPPEAAAASAPQSPGPEDLARENLPPETPAREKLPPESPARQRLASESPALQSLAPESPVPEGLVPEGQGGVRTDLASSVDYERRWLAGRVSTPEERRAFRASLGSRYDVAARAVARLLAERPGLRGSRMDEALMTELAAVRVFAGWDQARLVESIRAGAPGDDQAFAVCLAGGLRRLPSLRGVVVRGGPADARAADAYRPGQELVEAAPLVALHGARTEVPGAVEVLIWSATARRLDGFAEGTRVPEVVFLPGTAFRVLAVDPPPADAAEMRRVLLAEIPPGKAEPGNGQWADRVLARLEDAARERPRTPATPPSDRFAALPGDPARSTT